MKRINWAVLMRLGLRDLGLPPDTFWALTPVELMILAGADGASGAMTRGGFEALMRAFPDHPDDGGDDGGS